MFRPLGSSYAPGHTRVCVDLLQGFNVKSVHSQGFKLNIWDIGGEHWYDCDVALHVCVCVCVCVCTCTWHHVHICLLYIYTVCVHSRSKDNPTLLEALL